MRTWLPTPSVIDPSSLQIVMLAETQRLVEQHRGNTDNACAGLIWQYRRTEEVAYTRGEGGISWCSYSRRSSTWGIRRSGQLSNRLNADQARSEMPDEEEMEKDQGLTADFVANEALHRRTSQRRSVGGAADEGAALALSKQQRSSVRLSVGGHHSPASVVLSSMQPPSASTGRRQSSTRGIFLSGRDITRDREQGADFHQL